MSKQTAGADFETTLKQVEEIVDAIESGNLPLAEVVGKFREATAKIEQCRQMLTSIEKEMQELNGGETAKEE